MSTEKKTENEEKEKSELEKLEEQAHELKRKLVIQQFDTEMAEDRANKRWMESELAEIQRQISDIKQKEADAFGTIVTIANDLWRDASVSAQGHFFAADSWGGRHFWLGIIATAISATVGASIISENPQLTIVGGVLSLILVVVSAVSTFLNPEQRSTSHYKAGTNFHVLSNKAQVLVDIDMRLRNNPVPKLADQLKKLCDERDELTKNSLRLPLRYSEPAMKIWDEAERSRAKIMAELKEKEERIAREAYEPMVDQLQKQNEELKRTIEKLTTVVPAEQEPEKER